MMRTVDNGCGGRRGRRSAARASCTPRLRQRVRALRLSQPSGLRDAFTLIETSLATIIIGVGVLAIVAAQQAFHQQNGWSTHASIARHLGAEIREMTYTLPRNDPVTGDAIWGPEPNEVWVGDYDDLDDFDGEDGSGLVFSADWSSGTIDNGPINAQRRVITNMDGWSQTVTVFNVDPMNISASTPEADGSTEMVMVEVIVSYQAKNDLAPTEMTRVNWISPR